jgi:hypothetical protein
MNAREGKAEYVLSNEREEKERESMQLSKRRDEEGREVKDEANL